MNKYCPSKVNMPKEFRSELSQFMSIMKSIYFTINKQYMWAMQGVEVFHVLPHLHENVKRLVLLSQYWEYFHAALFTTKFSLIARTNNCILFHVNHPECTYNFLIIYCSYINIDQEELVYSTPWHVHSNPETHWSYHWIISTLTLFFNVIIIYLENKTYHSIFSTRILGSVSNKVPGYCRCLRFSKSGFPHF